VNVKEAGRAKTSKTDGRTLLAHSQSLRRQMSQSSGPADTAADAAAAADKTDDEDDASVVATGFAVIADYTDKQAPNDFFIPGRIFAVRVKHSDFPGRCRASFYFSFSVRCCQIILLAFYMKKFARTIDR